ncbi:high mobility group protein 20A-like isoform X2 [Belonocnema kinseyi]|uniref:high mobility group protein 20A-like isoform X2 n=1 Tax=Belonocnema kinseyi TaxID=2817044 RepID=UPI00143D080B|nr:high mobility group protein 20A-like isoform X2 [Belonocnema kinseyi]
MGNKTSSPIKSHESTGGHTEKQQNENPETKSRSQIKQSNKSRGTTNPFIVFFLRLRSKKQHIPVTKVARIAGKRWSQMNDEQRQKYVDMANAEKRRRDEIKRKRQNNIKIKSKSKSVYRRSVN